MPQSVAQIRQQCCQQKGCPHDLDYADPCAVCPEGHFGQWMRCEGDAAPLRANGKPPAPSAPDAAPEGPGTELKRLLGRLGIKAGPNCPCNRRAAEMDARGVDWCEANIEQVVGWLREEATRRWPLVPFASAVARRLVRAAIAAARQAPSTTAAGLPQITPETRSF